MKTSVAVAIALAAFACAYGCWMGKPWARIATVAFVGSWALLNLGFWGRHPYLQAATYARSYSNSIRILTLATDLVIIGYLLRPGAAASFRPVVPGVTHHKRPR